MNILFSVIMPIFQGAPWLSDSIESVKNQTYSEWELILINDGSTDGSGEIAERYAEEDSRILYYKQCNLGVSKARNRGIELARGEFLLFLDCDDYLEADTLYELEKVIDRHLQIEMIFFDYIYEIGGEERVITASGCQEGMLKKESHAEMVREFYDLHLLHNIGTKVYRRTVIQQTKFREAYSICEDVIFALEALEKSDYIFYIPKAFYHYIDRNGNSLINSYKYSFWEAREYLFGQLFAYYGTQEKRAKYEFWLQFSYLESVHDVLENEKDKCYDFEICKKISHSSIFRKCIRQLRRNPYRRKLSRKRKIKLYGIYHCATLMQKYLFAC